MAEIINCAGKHGTGNLEKNKAGTWIDIGLSRPLKCDQQRGNLQNAEQKSHERRTRGE